jgi:hypothetical protein
VTLTGGYKHKYLWWESVTFCRKAFIAGISVTFAEDLSKQMWIGMLTCSFFLSLHVLFHPYTELTITDSLTKQTRKTSIKQNL